MNKDLAMKIAKRLEEVDQQTDLSEHKPFNTASVADIIEAVLNAEQKAA